MWGEDYKLMAEDYYQLPTTWVQKNGQEILIEDMSTIHIQHSINLIHRRITKLSRKHIEAVDFLDKVEIEKAIKYQYKIMAALEEELIFR